mgnify:CR=1 FL=1
METKQITTEQLEKIKELAQDFRVEKGKAVYVYCGAMLPSDYCHFLGIDYTTVHYLGEVSYAVSCHETEEKTYQLYCETYINNAMNERLSFILEDKEDFLGLFAEKAEEEQRIGVAQWLPSNWKELMSDEQKEEIARSWCELYPEELVEYLGDADKEELADDYVANNASKYASRAFSCLSSYEQRDFIKDCIDDL